MALPSVISGFRSFFFKLVLTDGNMTFFVLFISIFHQIFFRKENIQFSDGIFFLSSIFPMMCRVQLCKIVGVLYNTNVREAPPLGDSQVAGSIPAMGYIFYQVLETLEHVPIFNGIS